MIIRKLFKFEGAHIVRDCSSDYCKKSVHGHSYIVEVFITSDRLDNGCMLVDFGLLKTTIKDFIESFDHAWSYWEREKDDYKQFVKMNSDRWIEMPISPSAEGYALLMFNVIDRILRNTEFNNGEGDVQLSSVRVHETATGYAEVFREDKKLWYLIDFDKIIFSPSIIKDWKDPEMFNKLQKGIKFINLKIELKYQNNA